MDYLIKVFNENSNIAINEEYIQFRKWDDDRSNVMREITVDVLGTNRTVVTLIFKLKNIN